MDRPTVASPRVVPVAWAGFLLIGWTGLLVPSLVRQIEAKFTVDDVALGFWYLAVSASYAAASFGGGFATERFGRRAILGTAAVLLALGLLAAGTAQGWPVFVLAAVPVGLGSGAIDGGMNALLLAVAVHGRGRALNVLHLFFSVGAFVAPLAVGRLIGAGIDWQLILIGTAVASVSVASALGRVTMPSGRRAREDSNGPAAGVPPAQPRNRLPLSLLAVAIACYVAGEVGLSNWMVRFLAAAPLERATLALSGFWAGLALGRLVAARLADRLPHAALASAAAIAAGVAALAGVVAPSIELATVAFAVAGFASGPVFPLIIAIGGDLYPGRQAAVAGSLTAVAVVGGTVYPPLVGLMSPAFGIATGMIGAAVLSAASGMAIVAASRSAR